MVLSGQQSVADAFSHIGEDEEKEFVLRDGSRIAVVGGGPAGSFFSYFLLKMAEAIDLGLAAGAPDKKQYWVEFKDWTVKVAK